MLLAAFFALLTNTSSTETVVFGMHFGQKSALVIPWAMALETIAAAALLALVAQGLAALAPNRQG